MQIDEIDPAAQRQVYLYLNKRYMEAESHLADHDPPSQLIDHAAPEVTQMTPRLIAAMGAITATDADREAWRHGTIRDDLYARWLAIEAGQLIKVPGSSIELRFLQPFERAGTRTSFLWRAADGARSRGLVLSITDQLRPTLQPPAEEAELWEAVVQVAMLKLLEASRELDEFFSAAEDLEILLTVNEVNPAWERGRRFPTL